MLAGKNVERPAAVVIVVALEEAAFLISVQFDIDRIPIQHALLRRRRVRFPKHVHQYLVDALLPAFL
jgi:hypothetical protein